MRLIYLLLNHGLCLLLLFDARAELRLPLSFLVLKFFFLDAQVLFEQGNLALCQLLTGDLLQFLLLEHVLVGHGRHLRALQRDETFFVAECDGFEHFLHDLAQ